MMDSTDRVGNATHEPGPKKLLVVSNKYGFMSPYLVALN